MQVGLSRGVSKMQTRGADQCQQDVYMRVLELPGCSLQVEREGCSNNKGGVQPTRERTIETVHGPGEGKGSNLTE
jgi:hypothetical protein